MFKALVAGALLFASNALRVQIDHEATQFTKIQEGQELSDIQNSWNDWFRDALPALGDSELRQIAAGKNEGAAKYFDNTGDDDEKVAWQLEAKGDEDHRRMQRVVQVKTRTLEDDPNVSTVTTTTFDRNNILETSRQNYA